MVSTDALARIQSYWDDLDYRESRPHLIGYLRALIDFGIITWDEGEGIQNNLFSGGKA